MHDVAVHLAKTDASNGRPIFGPESDFKIVFLSVFYNLTPQNVQAMPLDLANPQKSCSKLASCSPK